MTSQHRSSCLQLAKLWSIGMGPDLLLSPGGIDWLPALCSKHMGPKRAELSLCPKLTDNKTVSQYVWESWKHLPGIGTSHWRLQAFAASASRCFRQNLMQIVNFTIPKVKATKSVIHVYECTARRRCALRAPAHTHIDQSCSTIHFVIICIPLG